MFTSSAPFSSVSKGGGMNLEGDSSGGCVRGATNYERIVRRKRALNSTMDSCSQAPLLFLTFLQQRPMNSELRIELENLHRNVKHGAAPTGLFDQIVYQQDCLYDTDIECDGELQTDGHSFHHCLPRDIPQIDLVLPVAAEEAHAVSEVATELIRMADEFNQLIVSKAAEHLTTKLCNSSPKYWWRYLSQGVDSLRTEVPGVYSERMVMALTFSLAKAVCERAPRLLRDLCNSMTDYTFMTRPR